MNGHEERGRLDERLARLPAQIQPTPDLWPGIAARIAADHGAAGAAVARPSWRRWALAASIAVVAVLASHLYRGVDVPAPQATAPAVVETSPVAPTFGPDHPLGSGYQAARAGLADDLERRLEALPPETRAAVLENLETIRRAVAEINAALGDDPANTLLQQQLLAAYQDELALLANIKRITERLPMRNEI